MHTCDNCKYIVSVSYVYTYIKISAINDEKNCMRNNKLQKKPSNNRIYFQFKNSVLVQVGTYNILYMYIYLKNLRI